MSGQGEFDLRCDRNWCEELWDALAWGDSELMLTPEGDETGREAKKRLRFLDVAERLDFLGRGMRPLEA